MKKINLAKHSYSFLPYLILSALTLTSSISFSAESDSAADKLISDYSNNTYMASNLIYAAGDYAWNRKYEEAEKLYRAVIARQPDDRWGLRARLGLKRLEILNLIAEKNFNDARKELDLIAAEFSNNSDLAVVLFHIGQEFCWQRDYTDSQDTFDLIIERLPTNEIAPQAKLWRARANVCAIIRQTLPSADANAIRATDEDVLEAVDTFIKDFENDAGLADAMQWISKEYEWTKWAPGTSGSENAKRYDMPNSVYQKLSQRFSRTDYGVLADWDSKRMAHRTKILTLMEQGDQNQTDSAIEQMAAEFSGRPEIPGELCRIAIWYEEHKNNDKAGQIYERIIAEFPDGNIAEESVQDVVRLACDANKNLDTTEAIEQLTGRLRIRLGQTPQLASALCVIAGEYQRQSQISEQVKGDAEAAKAFLEKAVQIYNEAINITGTCPCKQQKFADALLKLGWINFRQGQLQEAISCFEKGLEKLPQDDKPADALYALAKMYEKTGQSDKAVQSYEQLQKLLPAGPRLDEINNKISQLKQQQ